mmetsp:Transcript_16430/g.39323  ORF Transcript_16430/g.39323 Transcript_16430/m.39323 type:complete len:178 (+) Transcript_16430:68-601(+)
MKRNMISTYTDTTRAFGFGTMNEAKGSFGHPDGSGSSDDGSSSTPIAHRPIQGGGLCGPPDTNASGAPRHRRVCFIDEVTRGPSRRSLVTSTMFRPQTRQEEKSSLYYTSKDFEFFALEDYYCQLQIIRKCQLPERVLGWEDCLVYEDDIFFETPCEETGCNVGAIHKVKTTYNLQS